MASPKPTIRGPENLALPNYLVSRSICAGKPSVLEIVLSFVGELFHISTRTSRLRYGRLVFRWLPIFKSFSIALCGSSNVFCAPIEVLSCLAF